jgi:hypothetical protein
MSSIKSWWEASKISEIAALTLSHSVSELLIVGECHFRVTHLIKVGPIHRTLNASQRLEGFLEKGTRQLS